jgi:hypothetical protein
VIQAVGQQLPGIPMVIFTDTGFHRSLPRRHAITRFLTRLPNNTASGDSAFMGSDMNGCGTDVPQCAGRRRKSSI